jgi:hypothetical protein
MDYDKDEDDDKDEGSAIKSKLINQFLHFS